MDTGAQELHGRLRQMIIGYWLSQAVLTAARLDVAESLKDGPKHCQELAREEGADPPSLYRLLRALASVGLFTEVEPEVFALAPLGRYLVSDTPGSLRALARMHAEDVHWGAWGKLTEAIQSGKTAFELAFGTPFFQYLAEKPELGSTFDQAMADFAQQENGAIAASYRFSGTEKVVDVGGGTGSLLAALLQAHPGLRGVLVDRPQAIAQAARLLRSRGLEERCERVAANFLEAVPAGGDVYVLKFILHNWSDEDARTILRNIRRVIGGEGRLLVIERVVPPGNAPGYAKLLDLQMLVLLGGRERTEKEYRALYASAGFELAHVIPTAPGLSLLEGVPV